MQRKSLRPNAGTKARLPYLLTAVAGGFAVTLVRNETQRHTTALKSAGQSPIGLLPLGNVFYLSHGFWPAALLVLVAPFVQTMYKSFSASNRVQTSMYKSANKQDGEGRSRLLPQQGGKQKKRQQWRQAVHKREGGNDRQPLRQLLAKPSHESIWFTRRRTAA